MKMQYLFIVLLGGKPQGRNIEQHDVFWGIGSCINDLEPDFCNFWPECVEPKTTLHVDAYRTVTKVGAYKINVVPSIKVGIADGYHHQNVPEKHNTTQEKLYFINLGGYKEGLFEEIHRKLLVVARTKAEAKKKVKEDSFFNEYPGSHKNAQPHFDDVADLSVDDVICLSEEITGEYQIQVLPLKKNNNHPEDEIHVGYLSIRQLRSNHKMVEERDDLANRRFAK